MAYVWKTVYGTNFACTQVSPGALVWPIGKGIILLQNVENPLKCYRPSPSAARYPGILQEISEYQTPQWIFPFIRPPYQVWGIYACQYDCQVDSLGLHYMLRVFHPKFTISSSDCSMLQGSLFVRRNYLYEILTLPGGKPYLEQHDRFIYGSVSKQVDLGPNWGLIPPSGSPVEIFHRPLGIAEPFFIGVAYTDQYGFFQLDIDSPILYNRTIPYGDYVQAFCFQKAGYPQIKIPYAGGECYYFSTPGVSASQDKMYPVVCRLGFTIGQNGKVSLNA